MPQGSVVSVRTISAASFRFLVRLIDAAADGHRDHRVVWSGCVAGEELNDGTAIWDWNLATQPMCHETGPAWRCRSPR
jgi:hypothetical protein